MRSRITKEDIIKLSDQLDELKIQYTDVEHAFDKIMYWQGIHKETPTDLFRFTRKEQGKTQILMDNWKNSYQDVKETISLTNKSCARMWNYTDEFLEQFKMPVMDELAQART
jgi:hypothetical protein